MQVKLCSLYGFLKRLTPKFLEFLIFSEILFFIAFFFFFLIKKRNKKNQGRKDYIPFLPYSYVQRLYYCEFSI